jgi:hypothetical protein
MLEAEEQYDARGCKLHQAAPDYSANSTSNEISVC